MKKGLVILIALTFFGGLAFADDGAMGPTITYGVTSYLGVNVLTNNTVLEDVAGSTDQAAVSENIFGTLPSDTTYYNGFGYQVLPWVNFASGPFSAKFAPGFYGNKNDGAYTNLNRFELTLGVAGTGYSVSDRIRYENQEGAATPSVTNHRIKGDFTMDNLLAGVVFQSGSAANGGSIDDFFKPLQTLVINDFQFGINDLLGFMDVRVGGIGTGYYYDTNNFRLGAIDWFAAHDANVASDNAPSDQGFRWIGMKDLTVPVVTTFNVGSIAMSVPLTIMTGVNVPIAGMAWRDFLAYDATGWGAANFSPMIASATYAMEGIGTFDIGAIPGFAYTQTTDDGLGVYTKSTADVTNVVFVDANISAIENLELQAAFDYKTQTMDSADPAATTGTGAAATPFVTTKVKAATINAGVEFVYDLGAVMEGLSVDGALAVASKTGMTDLNQTGTAYVAPTAAAGTYIAGNYSEAAKYGAMPSFIFGAGVSYDINENNSVSLSDEFDSMAGAIVIPGVTTYGYYNTNGISVSYSTMMGKGKLWAGLGYTMYLGLPAAADYQITGTNNIAAYNVALANAYKPVVFKLKYAAQY